MDTKIFRGRMLNLDTCLDCAYVGEILVFLKHPVLHAVAVDSHKYTCLFKDEFSSQVFLKHVHGTWHSMLM